MAVITRSKAKEARIRRLPTGPSSRSLRRTTTRVIICASATGEGVHTRWLRSKRTSESPAVEDSGRYVTPAPTAIQIPGAPLKVKGPNPNPPGTPPMFVLKPMEGIEEEGEHVCNTGSSMLGSPFSSSPPTDRVLERQATLPNSAFEGANGLDEGGAAGQRLKRRAFGANGTHLIDSEGNEIWV